MARRRRPRVGDWQPRPFKRTYFHYAPKTAADAIRKRTTVSNYKNPFHEGISEVMHEAAHTSKRACKMLAHNGAPGLRDVASDAKLQEAEREQSRWENRMKYLSDLADRRGRIQS